MVQTSQQVAARIHTQTSHDDSLRSRASDKASTKFGDAVGVMYSCSTLPDQIVAMLFSFCIDVSHELHRRRYTSIRGPDSSRALHLRRQAEATAPFHSACASLQSHWQNYIYKIEIPTSAGSGRGRITVRNPQMSLRVEVSRSTEGEVQL